jgi:hypothetical protein
MWTEKVSGKSQAKGVVRRFGMMRDVAVFPLQVPINKGEAVRFDALRDSLRLLINPIWHQEANEPTNA